MDPQILHTLVSFDRKFREIVEAIPFEAEFERFYPWIFNEFAIFGLLNLVD